MGSWPVSRPMPTINTTAPRLKPLPPPKRRPPLPALLSSRASTTLSLRRPFLQSMWESSCCCRNECCCWGGGAPVRSSGHVDSARKPDITHLPHSRSTRRLPRHLQLGALQPSAVVFLQLLLPSDYFIQNMLGVLA